jgi:hypothetical protein
VWVELSGGWHELKYFTLHKNGVDWVFIDHLSFQRPGTPYGNHAGPFNDNLFRFGLLSLGALEAPLNLPIKRDRWGPPWRGRAAGDAGGCWMVAAQPCACLAHACGECYCCIDARGAPTQHSACRDPGYGTLRFAQNHALLGM